MNLIGAFLLIAGAATAQDYRVTAKAGAVLSCLDREDVKEFVDTARAIDDSKDELDLGYNIGVHMRVADRIEWLRKQRQCAIYRPDDRLVLFEEDGDWIQLGKRPRRPWSGSNWFHDDNSRHIQLMEFPV